MFNINKKRFEDIFSIHLYQLGGVGGAGKKTKQIQTLLSASERPRHNRHILKYRKLPKYKQSFLPRKWPEQVDQRGLEAISGRC